MLLPLCYNYLAQCSTECANCVSSPYARRGPPLRSQILFGGILGGVIIWEFSVWGVNVSAALCAVLPYGTYIPVYGGGRGRRSCHCPALPLWKTFIHSIIEQPYIALCSLAIRLGIKLSLAYPYGQPLYPQHIPKRKMP